jgi:hypothetical protein
MDIKLSEIGLGGSLVSWGDLPTVDVLSAYTAADNRLGLVDVKFIVTFPWDARFTEFAFTTKIFLAKIG